MESREGFPHVAWIEDQFTAPSQCGKNKTLCKSMRYNPYRAFLNNGGISGLGVDVSKLVRQFEFVPASTPHEVGKQPQRPQHIGLPASMKAELRGKFVVRLDHSSRQDAEETQPAMKASAARRFNLQIECVQAAPIQRLAALRQQLLPQAIGQIV